MNRLSEIQNAIKNGQWKKAREWLNLYIDEGNYCDTVAILDACIHENNGDSEKQWSAIEKGLTYNPSNYELYVMLGNYYLNTNLKQAYLCYENAFFFCDDSIDKAEIEKLMINLKQKYYVSVPKVSIVILSSNLLDCTQRCIESIRNNTLNDSREIIVIDNASTDGSVEWLKSQRDIKWFANQKNMGVPVGYNQGIAMAETESDIMLLNNDTILPMNALFWLRMGLYESENVGSTGSVSNYGANGQAVKRQWNNDKEMMIFAQNNNVPVRYPYEEKLFLNDFSLLIKRTVMEQVGTMDTIFTPGNCEDMDYGLRILQAGYKNLLCKNSFVLNSRAEFLAKTEQRESNLLSRNQQILNAKWGMNLQYYINPRKELTSLIQECHTKTMNVLEIGCGCGATMAKVKERYPNAKTYGIDIVPDAAALANAIGKTICGDVEKMEFPFETNFFDYCIMGDVLEHLHEPKSVLVKLRKYMKTKGKIIISMPNVKHWSVIIPLLKQDLFSYSDSGILDRTHLKMYTLNEIMKLIVDAGYEIQQILYTNVGTLEEKDREFIETLVQYMETPDSTTFLAYQYIMVAQC